MRMLRWISGNIRKYKFRNEKICLKIGVAPIDKKVRKSRLRWLSHVTMRVINALIERVS
jgi:hypothetical protein